MGIEKSGFLGLYRLFAYKYENNVSLYFKHSVLEDWVWFTLAGCKMAFPLSVMALLLF
jgi:hypothetical protein